MSELTEQPALRRVAQFLEIYADEDQMMWPDFDPDIKRDLAAVKTLAHLSHQVPTKEWPLIFVEEHDSMLVVREWPNGEITAYWTSEIRDAASEQGDQ